MFKDLLSNLPYNPNLRSDVLFYSARLKDESAVRLIGFVFLFLAALVQVNAAISQHGKTFASDPSLNGLTPATNARCSVTVTPLAGSTSGFSATTLVYNNQLTPASYHYDVDANSTIDAIDNNTSTTDTHTFTNQSAGSHTVLVNVLLRSGPQYNNGIYHYTTCESSLTINPPGQAHVVTSKSVSDTTHPFTTLSRTAQAGDELVFKMTTQNTGNADYRDYSGRDNFASVLQYASIESPSQLSSQGVVLDANNYLNWTILDLKASSTDVKTVSVKVKNPLPVRTSNNCQITNTYGNQVTVNLACPGPTPTPEPPPTVTQTVNQAATSLPNTGPGSTVAIAFVVATVAGYFFSRNRLMAQELEIAGHDDELAGGQL